MFLSKATNGYYYLWYTDENGKRQKRSTRTKLKGEAMRMLAGMSVPQTVQPPSIRFSEFKPDLLGHAKSSFSAATVEIYERTLGHFCQLHGDLPLASINARHIDKYKAYRRTIVWGRSSTEVVQELFVRDLRTGKEHQITHGNALIADAWWAREDAVVYITDKSGFRNLWMVSPDGGEPTQITHASLNQLSIRSSAGGDRLLYLQQEASWSLRAVTVGTDRLKTLFSGESKIGHFDPSPDGTEIAWETREQGRNKIMLSNRDGTDRREIAQTDSAVAAILWSSNGKELAFALLPTTALFGPNAREGLPIYVVDPHVIEVPRLLTVGYPITWADSTVLVVLRNAHTWLIPVNGSEPRKFFRDSTFSMPVLGATYAFYTEGEGKDRWITRADGRGSPIRLPRTEDGDVWAFSPDNSFITVLTRTHKVLRFHFPECTVEPFQASLPDAGDSSVPEFRISRNGKEVFYAQQARLSRMIIIDRPFAEK
jgi:hypothetical protein